MLVPLSGKGCRLSQIPPVLVTVSADSDAARLKSRKHAVRIRLSIEVLQVKFPGARAEQPPVVG